MVPVCILDRDDASNRRLKGKLEHDNKKVRDPKKLTKGNRTGC